MLDILSDRTYRHLFLAQVVALLGTGLATVALGLLAFDLSGDGAALVLGTVFTIKMVAYVGIAPIAGAFADRVPRRALLVMLDLVRAGVALALPFVTEVWQVYVLIFLLQSASAAFTPTFQATIPDVLPEEARYTRALSLSRLAYDLENIVSPTLWPVRACNELPQSAQFCRNSTRAASPQLESCAEHADQRTFDHCSISPSATGIEVFRLRPQKVFFYRGLRRIH